MITSLSQAPLFSALSPEEMQRVSTIAIMRDYKKAELIFAQDEQCLGFYLLMDGTVRIYRSSADGKEQVLFLVKPYTTFAEAALFLGGEYPANAMALTDVRTVFFPKTSFLELLKQDSNLSLKLMAGMSQWLHRLVLLVDNLTLKDANRRLADYLISLSPAGNSNKECHIEIPVPKHILASQLGIAGETLSRTFHKLQEAGLITVDGKKIILHDIDKLQTWFPS